MPTIELEISKVSKEAPKWVYDIIKFLTTRELPLGKEEARKVKNKSTKFTMINATLYK